MHAFRGDARASGGTRVRLDSLTGVRFSAAFLVFGFHAIHYAPGGALDLFAAGMTGVSLFYIISGFVMSWTARPGDTVGAFYRRRFARIYPAFIAAWLLALALTWFGEHRVEPLAILAPPTLLQAWVPLEAVYFAASAVFWSLSCEAFFYLVFPFLHRIADRWSTTRVVVLGLSAAAVSLGVAVATIGLPENPLTRWMLVIFPPLRLMEFIIGMCIGIVFRRGARFGMPLTIAAPLAAASIVLAAFAPYSLSRYATTLIPFVLLVCSLARADLRGTPSIFRWRWMIALGVWSYCFYLTHTFALIGVTSIANKAGIAPLAGIGAALGAAIVVSAVMHIVVERPFERLLRGGGPRRLDDDEPPRDAVSSATA